MKILWWATAPWSSSSYSILTDRVVPALVREGHDVTLGTWYGLQGNPLPWKIHNRETKELVGTVTVLPSLDGANYGVGVIDAVYNELRPDAIITCSDVWVYPTKKTGRMNFCPWFPIDHAPIPSVILESLEPAMYPMCYSRWGVDILADADITAHYVPCSAPADIFAPGPGKAEARQRFGMPDPDEMDFLIVMVAANKDPQDRKGFNEALTGFARFAENHPQAYIYIHTNWEGPIKIQEMLKALGIQKRAIMPDQFRYNFGMLDRSYVANIYHAADVLLNPAKSEGFGLPLLEAQMCGCPIAATDYSTTDELLFAGWKIPVVPDWTTGADSFRARATVEGVIGVLEEAYLERDNVALREKARAGSIALDTGVVFDKYWRPAIFDIEKLISSKPAVFDMAEADQKSDHRHEWAKIGLYDNGDLCIPCLSVECEAELRIRPDGKQTINRAGFSMTVGGQPLEIDDDPKSGVAKIVAREIRDSYRLDEIDFRDGDVVVDIGSHVGVVSIYLAKKYPSLKIYSFEPDPENYRRLLGNLQKNGVDNVTAINKAVTGDGREVVVRRDPLNSGGSSLYTNGNGLQYKVESITLADIFRRIRGRCKLLKIDCEGAEYEILEKANSKLLRRIDHIRGEFHQGFPVSPDALLKRVSGLTNDIRVGGVKER